MLKSNQRYLQLAFNGDISQAARIIPTIPYDENILIEAGTPFIKRNGIGGIRLISNLWGGGVVADLKTSDGAVEEVHLAYAAGASAATVLGSSSTETLNLFIARCRDLKIDSMIDMLGVDDPLSVLRKLKSPPKVVIIHKGRDEESTKGKVIQYKHINKIKSKFDIIISAAGGVDLREASSAIFNGANIVVVNIVSESDHWTGISSSSNVAAMAMEFLKTIE